jgi:hypothetical protein
MQNSSQMIKKARRSSQTYSWSSRWSRTTAACRAMAVSCGLVRMIQRNRERLRGLGRKRTARRSCQCFYRARRARGRRHLAVDGRDPVDMRESARGMNLIETAGRGQGVDEAELWRSTTFLRWSPKATGDMELDLHRGVHL